MDCGTNNVCSPYFDPDFDSLLERLQGPACRVCIDNESLEDCTMVKIDSVNKQGLLLEVVQVLTDVNLTISKGYISSDAGWFMDVFHVKDDRGNKVTDTRVINYIQQAICANGANLKTRTNMVFESESLTEPTAIEMTAADRPGLFSEISAGLADLHCNIVKAHAWSHNERLACVAYISDQSTDTPIDDHRLAIIEEHLTTILRATPSPNPSPDSTCNKHEAKTAGLPEGEGTMTMVERRLHQLLLSERDFDRPSQVTSSPWTPLGRDCDEERKKRVAIGSCDEKGYSIVTVRCEDRRSLMFDTVCTLTDMQYVIFHASVNSSEGYAFQEYFIRHIDGCAMNTESEKERVIKCLEAAIERRVCEGIRVELCANNRIGLLSDITRVLRENGLVVVRADVETQGEKSVNAFYVRDISGNAVDLEFLESMKKEMGPIDLEIKNEKMVTIPASPRRSRFSFGDLFSQIGKFSHGLAIR